MRVAILGSGSAGAMATAHLSRHFPHFDLFQVHDPAKPPIGVGEGTTPGFRLWLEEIAPDSFASLQRECDATKKRGVRFERWGASEDAFVHDFVPQDNIGLHISAARLPSFFEQFYRAEQVHRRVSRILRQTGGVTLMLEEGPDLSVDLVIDGRGFPPVLGAEHTALSWIPTNAAVVTRGPCVDGLERTRAVARPHGWIFVIPLRKHTSYGYIYGDDTASDEQVKDDFSWFLSSEEVNQPATFRNIRFPNFMCNEVFDGRVFKIGNAASFIEPLEATSIALIKTELDVLTPWLRLFESSTGPRMAKDLVAGLNASIRQTMIEVSLFIAWHYAHGSAFDTPFWVKALERFENGLRNEVPMSVRASFNQQLERASQISVSQVTSAQTRTDLERILQRHRPFPKPFGGMNPVGFAQVAQGMAGR